MALTAPVFSQTEMQPWGNITGIRVDGQLMEFETSLQVVSKDWQHVNATALERQKPKYTRYKDQQTVTTKIDSFYFTQQVKENITANEAAINLQFKATKKTDDQRLFFCIKLPLATYANGNITNKENRRKHDDKILIDTLTNELDITSTTGLIINGGKEQLAIDFSGPKALLLKKIKGELYIYFPLQRGNISNGQTGNLNLKITAFGTADKTPVNVAINTADTGRLFTGFGGNFRLQNPKTDPQVVDYCLNNMRVAYGRVEMPWFLWQPDKDSNPIDSAKAGKLNPHVKESMEMAQRLSKLGMPVIVTAWFGPQWAVVGEISKGPRPDGVWGNPLDTSHMQEIYKSIGDYLSYLKTDYGVEAAMFSFNESDLGINIRQTGEEHAQLIKGLGAYLQSRELNTKLLLGDNSDANSYEFIYPAMQDTATYPYIGAISFHSWRGWDTATLKKWAEAATIMELPLIIGEGSIDAAAWAYPDIFQEQTYAIKEIALYTKLMAVCQPLTILQWQLTADYSPLIGGGIFGNNDSLHPGQRFYNLKQLASIPKDLYALPATTSAPYITCAAQGDSTRNAYAIHLVNDGATRMATISGLPETVKQLKVYTTSKNLNMKEGSIAVENGQAKLELPTESYTTLVSE